MSEFERKLGDLKINQLKDHEHVLIVVKKECKPCREVEEKYRREIEGELMSTIDIEEIDERVREELKIGEEDVPLPLLVTGNEEKTYICRTDKKICIDLEF